MGRPTTAVAVLGTTEVRTETGLVALRPRERSFLAALVLRGRAPARQLIALMWGDEAPPTARKSLQNHVVRIRGVTGRSLVVTTPTDYRIGDGLEIDVTRLADLVAEGRVAAEAGDWNRRVELADAGRALRRGPAYQDLPDVSEVVGERNRLAEVFCHLDEDAADALLRLGRPIEATALLERMVSEDPYRERRWELLMTARLMVGNRRDALLVVPLASRALREVGLLPGARLIELEERALADDLDGVIELALAGPDPARRRASATASRPAPPPPPSPPPPSPAPAEHGSHRPTTLFGRRHAHQVLERAAARTAEGRAIAVVVSGEAGIGKTSLMASFAAKRRIRGDTVLWGSGRAPAPVPLAAWREIVDQLLAVDPDALSKLSGSERSTVERTYAPPLTDPPPAPEVGGRERLFNAVVELLATSAAQRPTIVVLDDLHLAAPTTCRLLRHVASAPFPLLVAATVRTAEPTEAMRLFRGGPHGGAGDTLAEGAAHVEALHLPGFDQQAVDSYVRHLVGPLRIGVDALSWLRTQTGGNPLLLRETVRVLVDQGALDADRPFRPPPELERTSDALLLSRLEGLGAATLRALRVAAVLGAHFDAADLDALDDHANRCLEELMAAGLLVTESEGRQVDFAHQLIHEAVYRSIPEGERLELHDAAAEALTERAATSEAAGRGHDVPIFQIARHHLVTASLDPMRAVRSLRAAAERSLGAFAYEEGARALAKAAELAQRYDLGELLACELCIARGDALRQAGDPASLDVLLDAAGRAEGLGAGDLLGRAALTLCRLGPTSTSGVVHDRAAVVADRALRLARDPGVRAELGGAASLLHSMGGDPERCRSLYLDAEAEARRLGDPVILSRVLPHAFLALGAPWDVERRRAVATEVLDLADRIGDLPTEWEGHLLAYSTQVETGDAALFASARCLRHLADAIREPTREWETLFVEAGTVHLRGDLDDAEAIITRSLNLAGAVAASRVTATYGAQMLAVRIDQGRVAELLDDLAALVREQPGIAAWRAALALAAIEAGCHDLARRQLASFWPHDRLALPADYTWTAMAAVLARVAAQVGSPAMVADLINAIGPYAGRLAWGGSCSFGPVDTALGLLLVAAGQPERAGAAFARAAEVAARLGASCFTAEAQRLADATG